MFLVTALEMRHNVGMATTVPNASRTARDRARVELTDEIKAVARRHLADHGSAALSLRVLLQPYLKSETVLRCPSFPADVPLLGLLGLTYRGSGYGLNAVLVGEECEPRTVASLHHAPSEVALVGDSSVPWSDIWLERNPGSPWPRQWADAVSLRELDEWPRALPPPNSVYWGWQVSQDQDSTWGPELHGGGCNFAFADGHVKFLRPSQKVILLDPLPALNGAAPGRQASSRRAPNSSDRRYRASTAAVCALIEMPAEARRKMGMNARERVRELFDLGTITRRFEALYDELTLERGPCDASGRSLFAREQVSALQV